MKIQTGKYFKTRIGKYPPVNIALRLPPRGPTNLCKSLWNKDKGEVEGEYDSNLTIKKYQGGFQLLAITITDLMLQNLR